MLTRFHIIKRLFKTNYQLQTNLNIIKKPTESFINSTNKKYDIDLDDHDDDDDYENMFVYTNFHNYEWGGPMRGGSLPEPTRFGDWERNGRCTDY